MWVNAAADLSTLLAYEIEEVKQVITHSHEVQHTPKKKIGTPIGGTKIGCRRLPPASIKDV